MDHLFTAQQQRNANRRHYSLVEVMDWFEHTNGSELKYWCSEFAANVCQNHIDLARKAMRVNILWKQPQLLRLHESFDQIFQVRFSKRTKIFSSLFTLLLFVYNYSTTRKGHAIDAIRSQKILRCVWCVVRWFAWERIAANNLLETKVRNIKIQWVLE